MTRRPSESELGALGNELGEELKKKQSLAGYCGLILFAFDESQKLQRKDFSGYSLPATLCLRVNRSPRQVIVFSGFPILLAAICGPASDAGISISARTLRIAGKKNNSFKLIHMHRSIGIDQTRRRARERRASEVFAQSARGKRILILDCVSSCGFLRVERRAVLPGTCK